ncbi:DUF6174 domain-containing protein [Nocardioides lijunqiniae]|uniref:DUF6174 domain-containing protein n=1 Tax=Nocardioides lijunqiniae TaxID=2760832 RepID=UPI001878E604|nr:DUF6174 domain-containing protein [Nocardioides lijunqiniae]
MQPRRGLARRIPMLTLVPLLAASLVLVGCGAEDEPDTASDTGSGPASSPTSAPPSTPAAPPTVGTYPEFGPEDYTFTLVVSCFCADAGVPMRVTVVDDEVTEAVYTRGGRGVTDGGPVPRGRWTSLDDVIAAANDTDAEKVEVDWPAGQDHPSSVSVDTSTRIADEEVGYAVSDVVVNG